jgi:hypothetical protein
MVTGMMINLDEYVTQLNIPASEESMEIRAKSKIQMKEQAKMSKINSSYI